MSYEIVVRAGPEGESDDNIYRFIDSPIPKGVKSVDDPLYSLLSKSVLKIATKVVKKTGKDITLKLSVEKR